MLAPAGRVRALVATLARAHGKELLHIQRIACSRPVVGTCVTERRTSVLYLSFAPGIVFLAGHCPQMRCLGRLSGQQPMLSISCAAD